MTEHSSGTGPAPLYLLGRPAHQLLTDTAPELVTIVLDRVVTELPVYAELPREELRGDITRIIERSIRAFAAMLRSGGTLPSGPRAALLDDIVHRAEEGIPIDAVLSAHNVGVQAVWEHFSVQAGPDDLAAVLELNKLQLRYLREITSTAAAAYVRKRPESSDAEHAARQSLLSALLNGGDAEGTAARAGIRLARSHLLLDIAIAPHADEIETGTNPTAAARRKLRRLHAELERPLREPLLASLTSAGGIALLPNEEAAVDQDRRLEELVTSASRAAGAEITAGVVSSDTNELAAAADLAREVRLVAMSAGYPPGVYRLRDVALEYQLARPGPARDVLAARLEPLDAASGLLETLRTYIRAGLNRRRTATELHIHPNTVDYRLRRITALTGLDATDATGIIHLRAALIARSGQ